jgi:hypothetical protein
MKKLLIFMMVVVMLSSPVESKKLATGVYVHPLGYHNVLKQVKQHLKKLKKKSHKRKAVIEQPVIYTDPQSYLAYVVKQQGLSDYDYQVLNSIMYCESKYNPNAVNRYSGASGLFQFLGSSWAAWGQGSVFDPARNIEAAVRYYKVAGVSPWVQCAD